METVSVLIVGLGPSGMTLAHELEKHGVSYTIVDKRKAISSMTRAVNLTPATMASLRYSMKLSLDHEAINTSRIRLFWENKRIADIDYKNMNFPYKSFSYYPQPLLEEKFSQQLDKYTQRELTELLRIKEVQDGYEVLLFDHRRDKKYWLKCKYLIGCDGNNSTVRKWITDKNDTEDYGANFLLYDVVFKENLTIDSLYYVYENGYIIIVPIGPNRYRIILSFSKLNFNQTEQYNDIDFLENYLNMMLKKQSTPIQEILWFTHSRFSHRIASRSIYGNCILCGDAFHVFSPVGGLNMNTGIQDAINLGWKLAFVLQGKAEHNLLMSYESERSHAVRKIRDKTKHLTQCVTNATNYEGSRKYITALSNRVEQRFKLPYLLSGYDNYNLTEYSSYPNHLSVGHHISENIKCCDTYEMLCDAVNESVFTLIHGRLVPTDSTKGKLHDLNTLCHNHFGDDTWVLLRPDGFIAATGSSDDIGQAHNAVRQLINGDC